MSKKPKLFLDMDNTLVNTLPILDKSVEKAKKLGLRKPDQIPGIFKELKPIEKAIESINTLNNYYDLYILSTAPWENESSWSDKIHWLNKYFNNNENSPFYKRVIMSHDKGLSRADGGILIDDRPYHGASSWDDEKIGTDWIEYGLDDELTWNSKKLVQLLIRTAEIFNESDGKLNQRQALKIAQKELKIKKIHREDNNFSKSSWE